MRPSHGALPLAALIGLLTGGALAALASGGVLQRLRRLRDDARALHDDGLGHEVLVQDAGDEVDEVARALEDMRRRLVREEAGRQEFLSVASHELRTPLATLQGNLELLAEGLPTGDREPPPRRRGAAPDAQARRARLRPARHLEGIDGGAQRLSLQAVELGELAERVRDELGSGERIDGAPADPVHALADSAAVLRILRILVDNARVHGAGAITMALRSSEARRSSACRTRDPGRPTAHRERLFDGWVRGADAQGRAGSGLGPRDRARARRGDGRRAGRRGRTRAWS